MRAARIELRSVVRGLVVEVVHNGAPDPYRVSLVSGFRHVVFVQAPRIALNAAGGAAVLFAVDRAVSFPIDPDDAAALQAWLDDVRETAPADAAVTRERMAEGRY